LAAAYKKENAAKIAARLDAKKNAQVLAFAKLEAAKKTALARVEEQKTYDAKNFGVKVLDYMAAAKTALDKKAAL